MEHLIIAPVVVVIMLGLYFLPSVVAYARGHPSFVGILVLNLFLGWSLIGWVIALAWSFSDLRVILIRDDEASSSNPLNQAEALEKLAALRDQGILTPAEFEAKKKKILAL